RGELNYKGRQIAIKADYGIRYTVPSFIDLLRMPEELLVRFRVSEAFSQVKLCIYHDDILVKKIVKRIMAPGEMEEFKLRRSEMVQNKELRQIRIKIE
ncbi:MAG: pyridine nucleotide-disulfide oxidoreductase, partial [Lachnospiraceae bacterium]|nr:pyridine nucleotide-disulfide oxidoreductase [Lachnospiraceae bacterium]